MAIGVIDRVNVVIALVAVTRRRSTKRFHFIFLDSPTPTPTPNPNPIFDLGPQDPYLLFGSLQDLVDLLELKMPLIYNIHRQRGVAGPRFHRGLGLLQFNWGIPQSMSGLNLIHFTLTFGGVKYLTKVVAGLAADGRQIVGRTKSEANNYESLHDSPFDTTNLKNVCKKAELSQPNNKLMKLRSN
ncbi:hypothetical protein Prudu_267S000300 [Prunus dulcis]|uniref:Uncharacterized protein n=1 Tax=Prunus dulcis TaxID=3755 RepID=A0A5H2XIC9_PRUDU|nr:hypothetical protein Prudu_267S000300 [Prunus dulcis]